MKINRSFFRSVIEAKPEGIISGYAVLWDKPALVNGFNESYKRDSIKPHNSGVSLYFQHDKNNLLANSKAGTLRLNSDDKGLFYEANLPNFASDKKELIQRGDLQGVSIGFFCEKDTIKGDNRVIEKAEVFELSLVDKPALQTSLSMRDNLTERQKKIYRWNKLIIGI